MSLLIGEAYHLILNRRAVARTCAVNLSRIKRGAVDILADYVMRILVCIDDMARDLIYGIQSLFVGARGERCDIVLSLLQIEHVKVD